MDRGEALAVAFSGVEVVEFGVAGGLDRLHAVGERVQCLGLRGDHREFGFESRDPVDGLDVGEDRLMWRAQEVVMRKGSAGICTKYGRKIF